MGRFLRENWIWIVAPLVIVAILLIVIAVFSEKDAVTPFVYPL